MAGKTGKRVYNYMAIVKCPLGGTAWANSSDKGLRCTKCGGSGHDKVLQ
jgi:hypothetical protein